MSSEEFGLRVKQIWKETEMEETELEFTNDPLIIDSSLLNSNQLISLGNGGREEAVCTRDL